jgi:hypothetical protein
MRRTSGSRDGEEPACRAHRLRSGGERERPLREGSTKDRAQARSDGGAHPSIPHGSAHGFGHGHGSLEHVSTRRASITPRP